MDEEITWRGVAGIALAVAIISLLMSAGRCGMAERDFGVVNDKAEHLEERLDNHLRDHGK